MGRKAKDLTGMEFGYLRVLCKTDDKDSSNHVIWWCRCSLCGGFTSVRSDNLLSGRVISCGCSKSKSTKNDE